MSFIKRFSCKSVAAALGVATLLVSRCIAFTPTEDGLYAVFNTSKGEFAAKLEFEKAPLTVANFVGLAEGSIARWDEENESPIEGRFYDGLTFHRVVDGFVIQGGSPNGLGTDGPGYAIPDEMDADLTHSKAGILSMANSGTNSGGSQFFVTLDATSWLDGKHAVFGEVVSGMSVVNSIGSVATDSANKPTTAITINSIEILRRGNAAKAFDPKKIDVPNASYVNLEWTDRTTFSSLQFQRKNNANYYIETSENLSSWTAQEPLLADYSTPTTHKIEFDSNLQNGQARYASVLERKLIRYEDASGRKLTITLPENPTLTIDIESLSDGTYSFGDTTGALLGYYWLPLVDRDQLYIGFDKLASMQIYLTWTNESQGTCFVRVLASTPFNISGTFTAE